MSRTATLTMLGGDVVPSIGHYVASKRGKTAFLVVDVKMPKKPCGHVARLICERRPRTELSEKNAIVHGWTWSKR